MNAHSGRDATDSSQEIQFSLKALFLGVVPERQSELEKIWNEYQFVFHLMADETQPEVEAGMFTQVRYNHTMLRAVWVSAFAAWEGYVAVHKALMDGTGLVELERFKKVLECVQQIAVASDPFSVDLLWIPEPGRYVNELELRVPAELATFATAWIMLHEVQHLKHQQDGTSSTWEGSESQHAEELSCDSFAADFMTNKALEYATQNNVKLERVLLKRKTGIYFAMFALSVLAIGRWSASSSHPSVQTRLDNIIGRLPGPIVDQAIAIALGAFSALLLLYPAAPFPKIENYANTEKIRMEE